MRLFVFAIHHHEPLPLQKNVEADMISPLGLMGEPTLLWINTLQQEQSHKWEWCYIFIQNF